MIFIIDFGSSKTPLIKECVEQCEFNATVVKWDKCSEEAFVSARALILSGAPALLTKVDTSTYTTKFSFLHTLNIPILGICFGHQLIGLLNGATVFLGNENREKVNLTVIKNDFIFTDIETLRFQEDHTEGITLPTNFDLLASSSDYPVEAMKHKEKNMYGVQFHPEASGNNGMKLLHNFLQLSALK
ncbi:MAG: gamma-glutamyl-gamma-aminobutyrate hydrolase family protein [Bacteroidetes bacterium]|nr:gamma-glutamyl-gamma-aminobutyrate hydrolase family protein [Bacteroidota bacterium]